MTSTELMTKTIRRCLLTGSEDGGVRDCRFADREHTVEGVLKFAHDALFHHQMQQIAKSWKKQMKDVFQYVLDQRTPFTPDAE